MIRDYHLKEKSLNENPCYPWTHLKANWCICLFHIFLYVNLRSHMEVSVLNFVGTLEVKTPEFYDQEFFGVLRKI